MTRILLEVGLAWFFYFLFLKKALLGVPVFDDYELLKTREVWKSKIHLIVLVYSGVKFSSNVGTLCCLNFMDCLLIVYILHYLVL